MKIEVRNVKIWKCVTSGVTPCFRASVVLDDEPSGRVRNDGLVSANRYAPRWLGERLEAYARSLPPLDCWGGRVAQTADLLIDRAVQAFLVAEAYRKLAKTHVVYLSATGELRHGSPLPRDRVYLAARSRAGRPGVLRVLNLLPEEQALAILREKVRA